MAGVDPAFSAVATAVGRAPSTTGAAPPVVLAAAATGIVEHIERRGGDIDSIFGNTGMSPSMAGSPTLQIKLACFCRLFEEAAHQTGDENFGLWFGNQFRPHDLGLWGYLAVSSPTLGLRNRDAATAELRLASRITGGSRRTPFPWTRTVARSSTLPRRSTSIAPPPSPACFSPTNALLSGRVFWNAPAAIWMRLMLPVPDSDA